MGNSLGRPSRHPEGVYSHAPSGSRFTISQTGSKLRHRLERAGLTADYEAAYFVGSGHMGRSYLVQVGNYLFQSPASYYSRRQSWALSPGYERDRAPDFDRPVTPECLFCHAGQTRPVPGAINRYQDPPFVAEAISCERCHGPADTHVKNPRAGNMVNPVRLAPRARDSVCEQCHLAGEARILNRGAQFDDFRAGMELESVFSVFVRSRPAESHGVVSHSEQLALSACARASENRMWCGSCHDPHEKPSDPPSYYRERCLTCHQNGLSASHPPAREDCVACHMPRRSASDVPHTAVTDHRILRRPSSGESGQVEDLIAWREVTTALSQRNRGLAYISVGERDQSASLLNEGFRLLAQLNSSRDPDVLAALGLVFLRKGRTQESLRMFGQAVRIEASARNLLNLAVAQDQAGQTAEAIRSLERAIELDPSLEQAYGLLAQIYNKRGQHPARRELLERYLRFNPQNLSARQALQSIRGK